METTFDIDEKMVVVGQKFLFDMIEFLRTFSLAFSKHEMLVQMNFPTFSVHNTQENSKDVSFL